MLTVEGVRAAAVPKVWREVRPFIERALAEGAGHFAPEDIRAALLRRDMQLWIVRRPDRSAAGALVTEIVAYPRLKVCRLVLAAAADGGREDWLPWRRFVEDWARVQGCQAMELYGRPGWARIVRHDRKRVVLEWTL